MGSMESKVRSTYLNMALPKFVWITEVTTFKSYSADQTILGEIIFDSFANKMAVNDTICLFTCLVTCVSTATCRKVR